MDAVPQIYWMRAFLTRLAPVLFLALFGLGLTAATPGVARAESGHSHCEEESAPNTAVTVLSPAATTLRGADAPCGSCPASSCATHTVCLSGPVIALTAARPSAVAASRPAAPTVLPGAPRPHSFDQSPPTPPPNVSPVR
jgi:hypothetical protein